MVKKFVTTLVLFGVVSTLNASPSVLPLEERATVIDRLLMDRVKTILPKLMRRSGIDMWVIISREYNEDPVIRTFLPATQHAARRTTILLIFDRGMEQPLETLSVSRYPVGKIFSGAWNKEEDGEQWAHLGRLIADRNPQRIGVNYSEIYALADGISHTEFDLLSKALPKSLRGRLVSAESLAVGWLETRTAAEMQISVSYTHLTLPTNREV